MDIKDILELDWEWNIENIFDFETEVSDFNKINKWLEEIKFNSLYFDKNQETKSIAIDQKVCYDLLNFVCESILIITNEKKEYLFTNKDFNTNTEVCKKIKEKENSYGKGKISKLTEREYDKFFGQPCETLSFLNILEKVKLNNEIRTQNPHLERKRFAYKINNENFLKVLAKSEISCQYVLSYMCLNLVRFDKKIISSFKKFNSNPNISRNNIKFNIIDWIQKNSNRIEDAPQIHLKIAHNIAFLLQTRKYCSNQYNKLSLETLKDLTYFRPHRRDRKKPSHIPRKEYQSYNDKFPNSFDKNKNLIKEWNKAANEISSQEEFYISDLSGKKIFGAPTIHHIIPQKEKYFFEKKANLDINITENLILLEAGEHLNKAHLKGNTSAINEKEYEFILYKQLEKMNSYNKNEIGNYNIINFVKILEFLNDYEISMHIKDWDQMNKFERMKYITYTENLIQEFKNNLKQ